MEECSEFARSVGGVLNASGCSAGATRFPRKSRLFLQDTPTFGLPAPCAAVLFCGLLFTVSATTVFPPVKRKAGGQAHEIFCEKSTSLLSGSNGAFLSQVRCTEYPVITFSVAFACRVVGNCTTRSCKRFLRTAEVIACAQDHEFGRFRCSLYRGPRHP
ncbi:unnamed protein product, partial [Ectocarpus sp. 4 AP-2014]